MERVDPDSSCPQCSASLVEIGFNRGRSTLLMRSCSNCHSRYWLRDGVPVELPAALATMSVRHFPRRRRRVH
ncbi:MAG: hypothetical protein ACR2K0_03440 [Acidimicrobiales bacterium]